MGLVQSLDLVELLKDEARVFHVLNGSGVALASGVGLGHFHENDGSFEVVLSVDLHVQKQSLVQSLTSSEPLFGTRLFVGQQNQQVSQVVKSVRAWILSGSFSGNLHGSL